VSQLAGIIRQIQLTVNQSDESRALDSVLTATNKLSLIIAAHNALTKIIAPATPISLEATEPLPGWLGSIRRPPLVLAMIIIAILSIIGFVTTSVISASQQNKPPDTKTSPSASYKHSTFPVPLASFILVFDQETPSLGASPNAPSWIKLLNWCFAAALGAVFYVLFTVHDYVKNRTFDPRYNTVYVVRFVLGILSGLILAIVFSTPKFTNNEALRSLGPAVAALLGGFSAEAVYQVLQRLVEIMLSAVRGDNSAAAKAQVSDKTKNDILTVAGDPTLSRQTVNKLQAVAKKIGKK